MTKASSEQRPSPFSDRERELGLRVLKLVIGWSTWVHRRVESVHLESADSYRRRVSFDFTLPGELQTPIKDGSDSDIHFTPLTLLKKRPLTNFDLRDESGAALPLLTKQRNGLLTASLLRGLAVTVAPDDLRKEPDHGPSPDVEQALHRLALSGGDDASRVESELEPSKADSAASRAWRTELLAQPQFLAVARALTLNYLVVVPLRGPGRTRRIVKLAYDEPVSQQRSTPKHGVPYKVARKALSVIAGEEVGPRGRAEHRPGRLRRPLSISGDQTLIDVPAVSYGSSYHLEFVAPDGLIITRGELVPLVRGKRVAGAARSLRESRRRAQLYLPVGMLPLRGSSLGLIQGLGLVRLRPPPSTLVRASALLSLFTTALLLFVAIRWEGLVENAGAVPSLLLIVPAGLAALIARPSEAPINTRLLFGIRFAAVLAALCAYLAAATLVGGRSCRQNLFGETCSSWTATPWLLYAYAAITAATTVALGFAWLFSARPPEQSR